MKRRAWEIPEDLAPWERKAARADWDYEPLARSKPWPPWKCTTDQQRLLMEAKVNLALDDLAEKGLREASNVPLEDDPMWHELLIANATRKDRERLLALFGRPVAWQLIVDRALGIKHKPLSNLELASIEVDEVRQIWRRQYGLQNRKLDNKPFAEDIVARRSTRSGYAVGVGALRDLRRKKGRSKFSPL